MIQKIALLGAGTMGSRIAQFFAHYGFPTFVYDPDLNALAAAQEKLRNEKGSMSRVNSGGSGRNQSIEKYLKYTINLEEAISEADFIIESAPEDLEIKRELYNNIAPLLKKEAVVASNTSTYPLAKLSYQQSFADRLIITHFFNPAHIIPLVEIVQTPQTRPGLAKDIAAFLSNCGKVPIILKRDINGFIANRLQAAVLREACFLLENDIADARQIDTVMKESIGLRWALSGPFEIVDYGGLDIWVKVLSNLLADLNNQAEVPAILIEKVKQNDLGLKAGKGFFTYDSKDANEHSDERNLKFIKLLKIKGSKKASSDENTSCTL
jgi:3-hydroxybutyryl-CoA dehydrogenase